MLFAERSGFEDHKPIQIDSIDEKLRNRLFSFFAKLMEYIVDKAETYEYIADRLGYISTDYSTNEIIFQKRFLGLLPECKWYDPYTIIELFIKERKIAFGCATCDGCKENQYCQDKELIEGFPKSINKILQQENSGYRLINDMIVPITDEQEFFSIQESMEINISAAGKHISKALALFSDRESPDYENSVKESISAVEAILCYITGAKGHSATLGATLKKLEKNGMKIHSAMKEAFDKLYGYASDSSGIRHGGITFENAQAEDAKYMLVSCSAFVNYLKEKYEKFGGKD